jgi:hypothetical protein
MQTCVPNPLRHAFTTTARAAWATALTVLPLQAQDVVSPNDRAVFEGSTSSSYPLGRFDARFQQIHGDVAGSAGRTLTEHSYRRDAITERLDVPGFTTELEVVLSVSPHGPAQAQRAFAANHGTQPVTVLQRTRLAFPTTSRPGTAPSATFEHRIPYGTPFVLPPDAPLCVDVIIHGNVTPSGPDRNFSAYLDAHAWTASGALSEPGFVTEVGCPAPGSNTPHDARFTMRRDPRGAISLDIASQFGVPAPAAGSTWNALILGHGPFPIVWPANPACRIGPALDVTVRLPGSNDGTGAWSGSLPVPSTVGPGQRFLAQIVSADPSSGAVTFSDTSLLAVPVPAPPQIPAARIASGSDRSAPTGTVSSTVTVTSFR